MEVLELAKYKLRRVKQILTGRDKDTLKQAVRRDVVFIPIGQKAELEVYWKLTERGNGPAIILYVLAQPVIRIDCFGAGTGHAHLYLSVATQELNVATQKRENRWWLPETSVEAQIDRGLFEISKNANYWIQRHRNPIVNETSLHDRSLQKAGETARELMYNYAERTKAALHTNREVAHSSS